jgi:hypothetical protein
MPQDGSCAPKRASPLAAIKPTWTIAHPSRFEVIVTTFLASQGLALDQVPLTSGRDEQVSPEITDAALAEGFRRYHAKVALLDLVKNTANLAQSSRHRMKPTRIKLA